MNAKLNALFAQRSLLMQNLESLIAKIGMPVQEIPTQKTTRATPKKQPQTEAQTIYTLTPV